MGAVLLSNVCGYASYPTVKDEIMILNGDIGGFGEDPFSGADMMMHEEVCRSAH